MTNQLKLIFQLKSKSLDISNICDEIIQKISKAKRPVIFAGSGIRLSGEHDKFIEIVNKLLFRLKSVLRAKKSRYILLNAPNEKINAISSILPVLKSPTVLPLAQKGWSSMHSVINSEDFWEVINQLKENGAEDILVCPIEKMVL